MTRYDELFGTPERAVSTIKAIQCLDQDYYESCEGCPFWDWQEWRRTCPASRDRLGRLVPDESLVEWLKEWR